MEFNANLARASIRAAINSLSDRSDGVRLRPSNIGGCVLRLKFSLGMAQENDSRRNWAALQGTVNEELFGELLEIAGAQVLHPPAGQEVWLDEVEPDPDTGFKPHLDRLILWPEVGITDWTVLELKYLRATAQIALFAEGLQEEDGYWYQAVTYLMQSPKAIEQYAAIEKQRGLEPKWGALHALRVVPKHLLFFSIAKDPATTKMLLTQRLKPAQYETGDPSKLKPEQLARMEWRNQIRERLQEVGGDIDFHTELYSRDDPYIAEVYEDIKRRVRLLSEASTPADVLFEALSNLDARTEEDLPAECRFYCPFQTQHQMLLLEHQATNNNIENIFSRFDQTGRVE